jgi:SAM-dependent methyltransferase
VVGESIHEFLARLVPADSSRVLDLGCGRGATLVEIARRRPGIALVGLDRKKSLLEEAASAVAVAGGRLDIVHADGSMGLPFADAEFDCVVCHNVLERLPAPVDTINEIGRLLRPVGEALLSHTDFGTLVFNSTLPELTRQAVQSYVDRVPRWAERSDGLIGRKLPGLVEASMLDTIEVACHVTLTLTFASGEKGYERATQELTPLPSGLVPVCAQRRSSEGHLAGRGVSLAGLAERSLILPVGAGNSVRPVGCGQDLQVLISCEYWPFRHLLGLVVLPCRSGQANEVERLV